MSSLKSENSTWTEKSGRSIAREVTVLIVLSLIDIFKKKKKFYHSNHSPWLLTWIKKGPTCLIRVFVVYSSQIWIKTQFSPGFFTKFEGSKTPYRFLGLLYFSVFHLDKKRSRKEKMGLVGNEENGNGEMGLSAIHLGGKNKYRRMDSELTDDGGFDEASLQKQQQEERKRTTRKYVFACAVFASLNSVLLGYGESLSFKHLTSLFPN